MVTENQVLQVLFEFAFIHGGQPAGKTPHPVPALTLLFFKPA
jgi:hypothetical protein